MKLLLDQGLPRSTPTWLNQAGMDAIHVAEIGLVGVGWASVDLPTSNEMVGNDKPVAHPT